MNAEASDLFDRHIEQGILLRGRRELVAALREFSAACQLRPNSSGARCELAFTYLQAGALDDAQAAYLKVCEAESANVDALAGLGEISRQRGEISDALTYLQQAASIDPERIALQYDMAAVLRDLSRFDEARAVLDKLLARDPDNSSALIGLGLLARQRSDHVRSVELFRRAVQVQSNHLGIQLELALSLRYAGQKDDAANWYGSILDRDPASVEAAVGLAGILRENGDLTTALNRLRHAIEQTPGNSTLRLELGATLRELSHFDEAEKEYRAVHEAQRGSWPALVGLGLVARERGDYAAALSCFEDALDLQPGHPGLQSEVALTLRLLNRLDDAETIYTRAIEVDPRAAWPVQGLSLIELTRGQMEQAIALAKEACDLTPGNVDHRLLLAALYRDTGRSSEAAALVEECLVDNPDHAGAWLEKGLLLRLRQDRSAALVAFDRAATTDPQRGLIESAAEHMALGHPDQARAAYQQVLATAPMNYSALLGTAGMEMLAANYDQCVAICDSLIATYPRRVGPYRQKCRALIQLDRADEAVHIASDLDGIAPGSAEADATRLEILRTCGRRSEAEALLSSLRVTGSRNFELWLEGVLTRLTFYDLRGAEAALKDSPAVRAYERSRVLYVQGLLADLQWRFSDAVMAFEAALAIHADDPGAHHHLARLHFLRADAESSQHHLQEMTHLASSTLYLRGDSHNVSQNLTGQLLNELRLNSELQSRLTKGRDLESQRRIELLFEIVQSDARFTPSAIYLMLALRQSGALALTDVAIDPQVQPRIPRKLIQYWDQRHPPRDIADLMRTWVETHPGYQYCRFDDTAAREYLIAHYPEAVLNAYHCATHPAQKSDLFRLAYLFREGGWYVDADDRCVGNLSTIAQPNAQLIVYQEQYATLGNNFMGCIAGEPVIGHALNLAVETLNRGDSEAIWLATGPGLLTRAFAEILASQGAAWQDWLQHRRVLDRKELSHVSWPHSISRYKDTRRGWLRSVFKSRKAARISLTEHD